jgi:hypothetical protein
MFAFELVEINFVSFVAEFPKQFLNHGLSTHSYAAVDFPAGNHNARSQ